MKQVNKILALLLSVVMMFGAIATPVTATEQTEVTMSKTVVNPLYKDVISLEEAEQELSVFYAERSVSPYFDTIEKLGAHVKEQMINRATNISFSVPASMMDAIWDGAFLTEAFKYSDSCSGLEGDALKFGYYYYTTNVSGSDVSGYQVAITMTYHSNAQQEQQLTEKVNQVMSEMALNGKSEFEKAKIIYDYVCSHVEYDYTYSKYSAYNALVEGEAVCQGFATLYYRLCKEAGLSVRIISGMAGGPHAWNIVRIGNAYYNMDTTWDDESLSGNYGWSFKNEKEFPEHKRDDSYATLDFYKQYPMAPNSLNWDGNAVTYSKINADNSTYTYNTIDDVTVTSAVSGKPKLLIYYNDECPNSLNTITSLASNPMAGVDIVAIEVMQANKNDVKKVRDEFGNNSIIFTYDESGNVTSDMWNYARVGGFGNSIAFPLIVFVDANNKVQYVSSGSSDFMNVTDKLEKLCGYNPNWAKSISLNKNTLSFAEGSKNTEKLTAAVNPSDAINNRVVWSSSNPSVCTVDSAGLITPKGAGTAVVTANIGDESCVSKNVYATCVVTVGDANPGNGATEESEPQPPQLGWLASNGKSYWYEDGVKQGTCDDPKGVLGDGTVRGREIYDPVSDGWYWLDAVYDGAKAVNKEVWMPYIYQNEADWPQEEVRMNAEASGDMAEQVIREINNRSGKWVRYDENGKMYKGWYTVEGAQADIYPDQIGNTYYYDYRTGLMAKGEVEIDGVVYYFDTITGVLQK